MPEYQIPITKSAQKQLDKIPFQIAIGDKTDIYD